MPELHFYEWRITAWATSETRDRLDATGRGIYRELLDHCYAQGSFPDDPEWICRRCACTAEQLEKHWSTIVKHFPKSKSQGYRNSLPANIVRREYFAYVESQRKRRRDAIVKANQQRFIGKQAPTENTSGHSANQPNGNGNGNTTATATARDVRPRRAAGSVGSLSATPDYQVRYERLYEKHPQPGFKAEGQMRYLQILTESVDPELAADAIDREHDAWCTFWQGNPTDYRPGIGKYFEEGYYIRKPSKRTEKQQRSKQQEQADAWDKA